LSSCGLLIRTYRKPNTTAQMAPLASELEPLADPSDYDPAESLVGLSPPRQESRPWRSMVAGAVICSLAGLCCFGGSGRPSEAQFGGGQFVQKSEDRFECDEQGNKCKLANARIVLVEDPTAKSRYSAHWDYNSIEAVLFPMWTYFVASHGQPTYFGIVRGGNGDISANLAVWDRQEKGGEAKIEKCGDGVNCDPFGGEGTGVHGMCCWDDITPAATETYSFITLRYKRPDGRCEVAGWIHLPQLSEKYPGGWKHVMTASSGGDENCQIDGMDAWIEHFQNELSNKERRAIFGPHFYKEATGPWLSSDEVQVEWDQTQDDRKDSCVFGAFKDIGDGRIDASTGKRERNEALSSCPTELLTVSKPGCGLPSPLALFELHRKQLFEDGHVRHYKEKYEQDTSNTKTWCGGHKRVACSLCPWTDDSIFHKEAYCHADCKWERQQCMEKDC